MNFYSPDMWTAKSSSTYFPSVMTSCCFVVSSLQGVWDCESSPDNSFPVKLSYMLSIHLCFCLPFLVLISTSVTINLLPTYSSLSLHHGQYHSKSNLLSCTFLDMYPELVVPLIISFRILSNLVTPHIHLNILISATSNFFSCAFFTAHVSAPCIIAGFTTVCYTSPRVDPSFTQSP